MGKVKSALAEEALSLPFFEEVSFVSTIFVAGAASISVAGTTSISVVSPSSTTKIEVEYLVLICGKFMR